MAFFFFGSVSFEASTLALSFSFLIAALVYFLEKFILAATFGEAVVATIPFSTVFLMPFIAFFSDFRPLPGAFF